MLLTDASPEYLLEAYFLYPLHIFKKLYLPSSQEFFLFVGLLIGMCKYMMLKEFDGIVLDILYLCIFCMGLKSSFLLN